VAAPAALAATLARLRSIRALGGAVTRASAGHTGKRFRSCCLTACAGCAACVVVAGILTLAAGAALVAATASLVTGAGSDGCRGASRQTCVRAAGARAGVPMNCPGLSVSQGFGDTPWEHPHTGIDIVCPPDTLVVAVVAGVFHRDEGAPSACVFPIGHSGGLGPYGELDAGGFTFVYGHLSGFVAPDGARVIAGQPLGFEGATGCATGAHLHFEVISGGRPVDPCPLLPAGYPAAHDPSGLRCWGSVPP